MIVCFVVAQIRPINSEVIRANIRCGPIRCYPEVRNQIWRPPNRKYLHLGFWPNGNEISTDTAMFLGSGISIVLLWILSNVTWRGKFSNGKTIVSICPFTDTISYSLGQNLVELALFYMLKNM